MSEKKLNLAGSEGSGATDPQRRRVLGLAAAAVAYGVSGCADLHSAPAFAASSEGPGPDVASSDRVFITNEDSNTISVIDPAKNAVDTTINLTSFDEDPRPPFRFVTGGVMPTHVAMIQKPLYHGCISAHGAAPNPDGTMLAASGRGSSNIYLIDTVNRRVIGNTPNPQASASTSPERLSSGILVGREPHEPTFTRHGRELWVTLRGEDRIAIVDVGRAQREASGTAAGAIRAHVPTINGPAQVWFSKDGQLAFVVSQKVPQVEVMRLNADSSGYSRPARVAILDITAQDKPGFTPFQKNTPDGAQMWLSHKLADSVSAISLREPFNVLVNVPLGNLARPNHLEFVENRQGRVAYVSFARVDDGGPGGAASSRIAIIDRSVPVAQQKVVSTFFSGGREAHGLWTNPANNLLYVAHEQDELPGTPNAGQTVASAFDVSNPMQPKMLAQIPLGNLKLPSGELRNKKSINLVYVRPGHRGQTA
jgi:YVTN family beta-propeller protein